MARKRDQDPVQRERSRRVKRLVREVDDALREQISQADRSQASIDRSLGWAEGHVSQILRGRVRIGLEHLFGILDVLHVEPLDFFRQLFGTRDGALASGERGAGGGLRLDDEAEERIRRIVREELTRERAAGTVPSPGERARRTS